MTDRQKLIAQMAAQIAAGIEAASWADHDWQADDTAMRAVRVARAILEEIETV
jgi:hypothetical protein